MTHAVRAGRPCTAPSWSRRGSVRWDGQHTVPTIGPAPTPPPATPPALPPPTFPPPRLVRVHGLHPPSSASLVPPVQPSSPWLYGLVAPMWGGIAKPSTANVRRSGADGRGVAGVAKAGAWLRATELGTITETSGLHAGAAATTSRHADAGVRSEVNGLVMHPPPPVRSEHLNDRVDGPDGHGDDYGDGSAESDPGESSRDGSSKGEAGGRIFGVEGGATESGGAACGESNGSSSDEKARVLAREDATTSGEGAAKEDVDCTAMGVARLGGATLRTRQMITCTTGDAALRAGIVHAVAALGRYSVMATPRKNAVARASSTCGQMHARPEVFVVGQRPRRSVRLLVSMAQGCWVLSDTWILDSVHAREWQPCARYVPRMFSGVPAARAAAKAAKSLFNKLSIGWCGTLDIPNEDFCMMVDVAGGLVTALCAAVVVQGGGERMSSSGAGPRAVFVNQRWLPDSIASWRVLDYDAYKPE